MMTRRNIQWLIGLMSTAALMLVGFQWYWIQNAYELRAEQFNLKATDALQDVVRKLEKQEAVYMMRQRQAIDYQQKQLKNIRQVPLKKKPLPPFPNFGKLFSRKITSGKSSAIVSIVSSSSLVGDSLMLAMRGKTPGAHITIAQSDTTRSMMNPIKLFLKLKDITKTIEQKSETSENESFAKSKIKVLENARDLLFLQRPINERVSKAVVDSLLRRALVDRGLDSTFEFSVSMDNQQNVFRTTGYQPETAQDRVFKTTLFPNEIGSHTNLLSVYFPTRNHYLSRTLASTLLASGLLLLLMLGCFYAATTTILKQKKLADVKNDFINNMTHEFKTPISTIALATEMAQENAMQDAKTRRYLSIINAENHRLSGHVERVLQMAQMEKGNLTIQKVELDMHDLILSCLNSWEVRFEQSKAQITLELNAEQTTIFGDETHLTNTLNNLIDNALKYKSTHDDVKLKIATKNTDDRLLVTIADNGIGLSAEQCERVFEQFYRVPTGNLHDVKGFGLGLSYVKKIVEMHQGTVRVESRLGQGATFVISL